jgi:hypothetical protein
MKAAWIDFNNVAFQVVSCADCSPSLAGPSVTTQTANLPAAKICTNGPNLAKPVASPSVTSMVWPDLETRRHRLPRSL